LTFLEPALWWAAPLAAAPVVIHLLFLRRARTFWFSDLTLLRRAYLKTLPTSRLRDWLLLACRSLALLALVAAFAGPVVAPGARWAGVGASREGLSLVLLLDTSYSMGLRVAGTTRLELARKAGRALLSALGPEDRVAAAAFADRPPGLAWARSPREADAALDAPLTLRGTDASAALRTAYAFLSSEPGARKGVVLLSDNSAHAFPGGAPSPPSGVKVLGLGWRDQPSNAYAADLQSRPLASGGVVGPNPLRKATTTPPGDTGLDAVTGE